MDTIEALANREYKYGFVTEIESETVPRGLNEEIVRTISEKKKEPQWMLDWRLKAYRHWQTMEEPEWANVKYPKIDYQDIIYYSAPKQKEKKQSLDEVDPQLLDTFEKLGIPLHEQKLLANVAVDAIFDSVSVATTFKDKLAKAGVIFCSFSESGQFERTLIIAEESSHVSYLEGCTAPKFDKNQLHAAVVELVALDNAEIKYSTVQNWYAGDENGVGGIY